uniref:Uncharacterized protein n=1 Tax=Knipowitschia caucasica TaxID=637954 RepID=A0AAV2LSC9_KNICA
MKYALVDPAATGLTAPGGSRCHRPHSPRWIPLPRAHSPRWIPLPQASQPPVDPPRPHSPRWIPLPQASQPPVDPAATGLTAPGGSRCPRPHSPRWIPLPQASQPPVDPAATGLTAPGGSRCPRPHSPRWIPLPQASQPPVDPAAPGLTLGRLVHLSLNPALGNSALTRLWIVSPGPGWEKGTRGCTHGTPGGGRWRRGVGQVAGGGQVGENLLYR